MDHEECMESCAHSMHICPILTHAWGTTSSSLVPFVILIQHQSNLLHATAYSVVLDDTITPCICYTSYAPLLLLMVHEPSHCLGDI